MDNLSAGKDVAKASPRITGFAVLEKVPKEYLEFELFGSFSPLNYRQQYTLKTAKNRVPEKIGRK